MPPPDATSLSTRVAWAVLVVLAALTGYLAFTLPVQVPHPDLVWPLIWVVPLAVEVVIGHLRVHPWWVLLLVGVPFLVAGIPGLAMSTPLWIIGVPFLALCTAAYLTLVNALVLLARRRTQRREAKRRQAVAPAR
ncbi:hypothetical protein [Kineococcus terrestris]|uniref:hypothetical protein n=1 Tax=Kineococcus terrestris TaxID=2044856 RepID=UPI0034DB31D2